MNLRFAQYFGLLVKYLSIQRFRVFLMAVALLVSIALELYSPQVQGQFVRLVQTRASLDALTSMALLFLIVALSSQVISSVAAYFSRDVATTATNSLSEDLTLHCLTLDPSFHKTHSPGALLERIDGDAGTLSNFFSQFVVRIVGNSLLILGILTYMLIVNIWIGLALIVYALLVLGVMRYLQARTVPFFIKTRQAASEMSGFYEEHMRGVEDLSSSGAIPYVLRRYIENQRRVNMVGIQAGLFQQVQNVAISFLIVLAETIVLTIGAYLFTRHVIDMGVIFVLLSYVTMFSNQIVNVSYQLGSVQEAIASIKRISEWYYTPSKVQDGPGISLPTGPVSVSFDHVSFGYDEGQSILSDVDFQLAPGETLGLIGRSGSGKTTLTRLLFRFYDPTQGTIRFNNLDIRQAHLQDLRAHIGLVTQEVQLFEASLRDNLTFFDETISDERLLSIIENLGLGPWYHALPEGLDTKLTPAGSSLSAGEAQLLALTRVFLKDPSLIILDEASSRLDMATEHIYMQATRTLLQNRTGIIIAHRLATVQHVDNILVLEGGRVLEYGKRAQLAQDPNSRYHQLLNSISLEELLV